MPAGSGIDLRAHPRSDYFATVRVEDGEGVQEIPALDLSCGGIRLSTSHPLPRGTRPRLWLPLGSSELLIDEAEVVWTRRFEPISVDGVLPGMGLRFRSLTEEARRELERYLTPDPVEADGVKQEPEEVERPGGRRGFRGMRAGLWVGAVVGTVAAIGFAFPRGGPGESPPTVALDAPTAAAPAATASVAIAQEAASVELQGPRAVPESKGRVGTPLIRPDGRGWKLLIPTPPGMRFRYSRLERPPRLVIDLLGGEYAGASPTVPPEAPLQVRVGRHHGYVRVVVESEEKLRDPRPKRIPAGLAVAL